VDAVVLLQQVHRAARQELGGRDPETDLLLSLWEDTLAALASAPETLVGRVDWITKRWLLQQFCDQEQIPWSDPWLKSQDLEYHHTDPARSLGLAAARTPPPWEIPPEEAARAVLQPPANTRARARSRVMRLLQNEPCSYYIDWEIIGVEGGHALHLLNPFDPSPREAEKWMQFLTEPAAAPPQSARRANGIR
jgi:proteasome accessory factor A